MANVSRFNDGSTPIKAGADNTSRILDNLFQEVPYAASVTLKPRNHSSTYRVALTGAFTLNIAVGSATTAPYVGDKITIIWVVDGTSRTVTWGTGIQGTAATQVITTAKFSTTSMMFDGAAWLVTGTSVSA